METVCYFSCTVRVLRAFKDTDTNPGPGTLCLAETIEQLCM